MKNIRILLTVACSAYSLIVSAQTQSTIWTNSLNVTVHGDNSLTKTGVDGTWDSGINSKNLLLAGQNGFVQFTFQPSTSNYAVGLSRLNNVSNYTSTDYTLYISNNALYVYNMSTLRGGPYTIAAGNVLKVSREANAVKFYVNTTVVFTQTISNNVDVLCADVSIHTGSAPVVEASFSPALVVKPTRQFPSQANNDGSISIETEGQVDPVTYSWSSGESTSSISGKARGSYTVTATDAQARTVTKTYNLGYPISWNNLTEVEVNPDNSITKTGTGSWGVSGASSANTLPPNTNGWVEFVVNEHTSHYMIGLSREDPDAEYTTINYAWYITANGGSHIYENGVQINNVYSTFMKGDVFRIAREGTAIRYYLNGVLKRSLTGTAGYSYIVDISVANNFGPLPVITTSFSAPFVLKPTRQFPTLANNDGLISLEIEGQTDPVTYSWSSSETTSSITGKARGAYTVTATDAQLLTVTRTYNLGYPIAWNNLEAVTVNSNNTLTKTAVNGWGNSGASSINRLAANTNGWVEFVVNDIGPTYMIGLSKMDKGTNYTTINYAWYVAHTGVANVYEDGANVNIPTSVQKGDVFRVSREGSLIRYYLNGVLKRSVSNVPATVSYLVDVSIHNNVGALPLVTASFDKQIFATPGFTFPDNNNQNGSIALSINGTYSPHTILWSSGETSNLITGKARGTYTATITDAASRTFTRSYRLGYPVEWTDLKNAAVNSSNVVYKINDGNGTWDAGAVSSNILSPSTDGWIEYMLPSPSHTSMVGLSRINSVASYTSLEYAFYTVNDLIYIYESGTNRGAMGNQIEGTVLTIAREGSNIKYYINGSVVRTVATTPSYELVADQSILLGASAIVTASFSRTPQTFYAIANGNWTSPEIWSLAENGAPATVYPGNSDLAVVKGHNVTVTSGVNSAGITVVAETPGTCLTVDGAQGDLSVKGNVVIHGENNTETFKALIVQNEGKLTVTDL